MGFYGGTRGINTTTNNLHTSKFLVKAIGIMMKEIWELRETLGSTMIESCMLSYTYVILLKCLTYIFGYKISCYSPEYYQENRCTDIIWHVLSSWKLFIRACVRISIECFRKVVNICDITPRRNFWDKRSNMSVFILSEVFYCIKSSSFLRPRHVTQHPNFCKP